VLASLLVRSERECHARTSLRQGPERADRRCCVSCPAASTGSPVSLRTSACGRALEAPAPPRRRWPTVSSTC